MIEEKKVKEANSGQKASLVVDERMIPVKNPEVTFREEMGAFLDFPHSLKNFSRT